MLAASTIGLPMALSLGLLYGLGPCLVSCMPYLAPVFLARDVGLRNSWHVVLPLAIGRLAGYSAMGLAAGIAGRAFTDGVSAPTLRLLVGSAAVMVGLALLWRRPVCSAARRAVPLRRFDVRAEPRPLLPGGLLLMGIGMALTPCAPMGVVIVSAATSASAAQGLLLGAAFGLGAIVVPSLVFGIGAAYMGQRLREELGRFRPALERLSAGLLIVVGLTNILN